LYFILYVLFVLYLFDIIHNEWSPNRSLFYFIMINSGMKLHVPTQYLHNYMYYTIRIEHTPGDLFRSEKILRYNIKDLRLNDLDISILYVNVRIKNSDKHKQCVEYSYYLPDVWVILMEH